MTCIAKFGKYEAMEATGMFQVHERNAFGRFVVFHNVSSRENAVKYAKQCHMAHCARTMPAYCAGIGGA